jgi:phage terminase large subunit-like protein
VTEERALVDDASLSAAAAVAVRLVANLGREEAHRAGDLIFDSMSVVDAAALAYDWSFWARPKQKAPEGRWRSWGFLTGRGFGKTKSVSEFINDEVQLDRAPLIGLAAQDEDNCIAIQVLGPSGLIATAPPWHKPEWEASKKELVWPNGSRAYVRTPEVPGKIRGLEYMLFWATEIQSWPKKTMVDAFDNVEISTRLGLARIVWDATPKRRHPILAALLEQAKTDPENHRIVRGTTHENEMNLAENYIEILDRKYGGTARGREELLGEMLEDAEGATVKQIWIDANRRPMPDAMSRRAISIDPAVSTGKGSDRSGIVKGGLAADGRACITGDFSGKHSATAWGSLVLDIYVTDRCDVVIAERNKGGDLVVQNLRALAKERDLQIIVLGKKERAPGHTPGVVHVREIHSRGEKSDRAQPVSTAYEKGRVCHIEGVDLKTLEDTLTTWVPSPNGPSPDDLDALVGLVVELLELQDAEPDNRAGFKGLEQAAKALATAGGGTSLKDAKPAGVRAVLAELGKLGSGRGGRI